VLTRWWALAQFEHFPYLNTPWSQRVWITDFLLYFTAKYSRYKIHVMTDTVQLS